MNQPLELTVMMYHYIRDPGDAADAGTGIPGMSVKAFEMQLDELSKRHTFVSWPDVRMALEGGRALPSSACLLTFDDGVYDHYIHAFRILQKRKISGLFFVLDRSRGERLIIGHKIHFLLAKLGLVGLRDAIWEDLDSLHKEQFTQAEKKYQLKYPLISMDGRIDLLKAVLQRDLSDEVEPQLSDLFERHIGSEMEMAPFYYLNPDQIREMSTAGMHFGGHSHSHPWFDWIDAEQRETEIEASAELLSQIEPGPWAFAYPYGGVSDDSPILLKQHGFIAAFTTNTQLRHTNPYFIGRLDGEEIVQGDSSYA